MPFIPLRNKDTRMKRIQVILIPPQLVRRLSRQRLPFHAGVNQQRPSAKTQCKPAKRFIWLKCPKNPPTPRSLHYNLPDIRTVEEELRSCSITEHQ